MNKPPPWSFDVRVCISLTARSHSIMAQEYTLFVDARERHLAALFGAGAVTVMTLDVGDVRCEYADGTSWILERKTAIDG